MTFEALGFRQASGEGRAQPPVQMEHDDADGDRSERGGEGRSFKFAMVK
jgi:hypothetical protein